MGHAEVVSTHVDVSSGRWIEATKNGWVVVSGLGWVQLTVPSIDRSPFVDNHEYERLVG